MDGLRELLLLGLEHLYGAHHQSAQQAAANARTSTHPRLKTAAAQGSKQNLLQTKRLEKVFKALRAKPGGRADAGMQGLIEANDKLQSETIVPAERDLINIALGQTAAHFYIAKYGTMRAYAEELGNGKAAGLLGKTLRENVELDKRLTDVAEQVIAGMDRPKKKTSAPRKVLSALTGVGALTTLAVTVGYGRGNSQG